MVLSNKSGGIIGNLIRIENKGELAEKETESEDAQNIPQYGGTMNLRIDSDIMTFDPNARSFITA